MSPLTILTLCAGGATCAAGIALTLRRGDLRFGWAVVSGAALIAAWALDAVKPVQPWLGVAAAASVWALSQAWRADQRNTKTAKQLIELHEQLVRFARDDASSSAEASFIRFSKFAQLSPVGIFELEPDGRLHYSNARLREFLGDGIDEWHSASLVDGIAKSQREEARERVDRAIRECTEFEFEFRTRASSTPRWLLCRAAPQITDSGDLLGFIGTVTDMTDRRAADAARRELEVQKQNAQRLESLRQLAGGVAHNLNNMLIGILGSVTSIARTLDDSSELHRQIEALQEASHRAAALARHMSLAAGRAATRRIEVDLVAETTELESRIRAETGRETSLIENPPTLAAFGDRDQIRELIEQLLRNAAEATGKAGRVEVTFGVGQPRPGSADSTFVVEGDPEAEYAWVEVRDFGTGMPPELVQRIFDPYFSTKHDTRGIGLALVLGVVRTHRGAINVHSAPAAGTAVRVYLPRPDLAAGSITSPSAQP